ncbi:MAG: hypothetical protein K9N09_09230 [Candidatus Cloacimonetes bacterium]|nr:hypothetical protein [Candidatus Cloacimonadota bacterium]MCF7814181.1 hypothetical protein [Candidatus Cloacimonadota bacterium]MCF7868870.1 hypothetical protein [Candidatus Cloacimonadota bacterium]MCF7884237.1 hypothetical protein [Candidatus Cloacimonadota bacterium]
MIYEVQTVKRNFQLELKEEWQWNDETGQTVAVRALNVNEFDDSVKVY